MAEIKVYRHGDLLLHHTNKPKKARKKVKEGNCILEGEVTNHHHRASAGATVEICVDEPSQANDYHRGTVIAPAKTTITHEEHDTITLRKGKYDAYVQREYDPIFERRVVD